MSKNRRSPGSRLSGVVMVFYFLAFLLLAVRDGALQGYILAAAVPVLIFLGTHLLPRLFPADQILLSLTHFLCALGILVLYDVNPAYARQQAIAYGIGIAAMIFCIYLVRSRGAWNWTIGILMPASLILLALPLLFGQETNGARNWIVLGPVSFQPSEVVKLSLVLILAYYLSRRRMLPWLGFAAGCLVLLMLQKDLGTALLYYTTALLLFWSSAGNPLLLLAGIAGGGAAAWWGYGHFAHVRRRVAAWLDPWKDYLDSGYQLVQSLVAIASGGLFGVGLGLGSPRSIPVYESDFIFAVLCEQFGLIFGLCVLLIYAALIWRGAAVALQASRRFHGLIAMGATVLLGLQALLIIGGVFKLIPLTGVTLPFVSYGGTSLISSLCLAGLIQGVASLNEDDLDDDTHLAMLGQ